MTEAAERKARARMRKAQAAFERAQSKRDEASASRRKSFEQAQATGLTVRDIAEETGLGFGRVTEIIPPKAIKKISEATRSAASLNP